MTDAARCEKIMKRVRDVLERSQFFACLIVKWRKMETCTNAPMRCITSLLGLNFFCVFPYEEWIDSLLEWIIIYFYFNPFEFVRDAYRVTEKRAVISSEQHFVSTNLATTTTS